MNPKQEADASAQGRFHAWSFAWKLVNDYPLTGGGFETFTPGALQRVHRTNDLASWSS